MISFTTTVEIERPLDEVFEYVADLENLPRWNEAIVRTTKTSAGPTRVGTKYRQYRDRPKPATEILEIVALWPRQRLEVSGRLAQSPAHLTYRFTECKNGTRLANDIEVEPQGVISLIAPLLSTRIRHTVADNLVGLKNVLETS